MNARAWWRCSTTTLAVVALYASFAAPAAAVTTTVDGRQGTSLTHTVSTVSPDAVSPGDVLRIDTDSTLVVDQPRCGIVQTPLSNLINPIEFFSAEGAGPRAYPDPYVLFTVFATRTGTHSPIVQVGACQQRERFVSHTELTFPTAEELRGFGVGDGPLRVMPLILRDTGVGVVFTSGELPVITVRGISAARTSSATASPVREIRLSAEDGTPSEDRILGVAPKAATGAPLLLAILLCLLLLGPRRGSSPVVERGVSLLLRLISAGLVIQQVAAGQFGVVAMLNVGLFVVSFAPNAERRRRRNAATTITAETDESRAVDIAP